jgi:O-acetylhomoserine/O-acetylserine sulfhydrylase-like pyridoxal-dependent enzyme
MIDPRFTDPEQLQRLHQQKMEAMKVIMSEIIDNPSGVSVNDLKKVVNYLDKDSSNNVDND